jgi:alanine racemase
VGYSRAFVADRAMRYATLPVGYADGLSRHLSGGKGHVIIGGQACAILGNVCMDMVMVDVSEVVVAAGDEVIIIGADQGANELAHAAGTIGYEVLTGIGPRVPRFYLKD